MSAPEGAKIEDLLAQLGEEPLLREAEAMGLAPRGRRMRCPFAGCADVKLGDRERDAQLYQGRHPRIFCFRCNTKGDLVDVLQRSRGWSQAEAIAHLTGLPPPKPALRVVPSSAPAEDPEKLTPAEVRQLWDGMAHEDELGQKYLEGRGLEDAVELGLVRFATESHPSKPTSKQGLRGYRVAALLSDVVGNPRGIQLRKCGEPRAQEPKILSVKGSATGRSFFGSPDAIESEGVVAVAEGLADTLALASWVARKPGVAVVGAAGKDALPHLADELGAAGVPLAGKRFALFPQNDRPQNKSRRAFTRLAQKLTALGADVTWCGTPEEFKDLAVWLQAQPDLEWPPPELARALLPEPGDDSKRDEKPVLPAGCAVPLPPQVRVDNFGQNFSTLCALLDDPVFREPVCGRGELTWCEMTWRIRIGGIAMAETDLSAVRLGLEGQRATDGKPLRFPKRDIADALSMLARRKAVHPIRDWQNGLKWDGKHRLDTELPQVLGQEPNSFASVLLRRWLISAVARAQQPGCKVDTVLVLVGAKGLKKSTFFDAIGGQWFTDSPVQVGDKDGKLIMREAWIIEWAELAAMKRSRDVESLKAFISARVDLFRRPYGQELVEAPRHCVIVGTSNPDEILSDPTGNRRIWPVRVSGQRIDIDWVRSNREQLVAEALHRYREREQWWLTDEEDAELDALGAEFEARHPWTELVEDWLADRGGLLSEEVTATQVLVHALNKPDKELTNGDQQTVGNILRQLGWVKRRRSGGGSLRWVYVRP